MADDHAPVDCLTGPDQRLNALSKLEVSKARPNRGILRTMFVNIPTDETARNKSVTLTTKATQQATPRASFLVPSL
jgi:hypothetical protein